MADPWVLEVQKWLNKEYGTKPNYGSVPENGLTGWDTVYGIIRAIQLELSVTDTPVDNFGVGTQDSWDLKAAPELQIGYSGNIVKLLDAGFRCKGFGTGKFDMKYTADNDSAILSFKAAAGITTTETSFDSMWAYALFNMSAFALVDNGDPNVRTMQQTLNAKYQQYFGILPCDGVYQRDTNTALIYALQAETGMKVGTANGNYGPGTTANTPTLTVGMSSSVVTILQWGLYVNGYNKNAQFDSIFSDYIGTEVQLFRSFMAIEPYNTSADVSVMKALLTSNGDTDRRALACDTSTILSKEQIGILIEAGYTTVGRYLTGTVGVGDDERDKSLSYEEISNIINGGLKIFPIYQDGGWDQEYFTAEQGTIDANTAHQAATNLYFPDGITIYFAVDVDIQSGDLPGTVVAYFEAVSSRMKELSSYDVGVYGTRNICSTIINNGYAKMCFVSDMSTGFSGNLGFPMPELWAFDQFYETTVGGVAIDKVALSGKDSGVSTFNISAEGIAKNELSKLLEKYIHNIEFQFDKEYEVSPSPNVIVYVKGANGWDTTVGDKGVSLEVTGSKVDMSLYISELRQNIVKYSQALSPDITKYEDLFNELAPIVKTGFIAAGLKYRDGLLGTQIIFTFDRKETVNGYEVEAKFQFIIETYVKPVDDFGITGAAYSSLVSQVEDTSFLVDPTLVFGGLLVFGLGVLIIVATPVEIVAAIGTGAVLLTEAAIEAAESLTMIASDEAVIFFSNLGTTFITVIQASVA